MADGEGIVHGACGRTHRTQKAYDSCQQRAEKKAAREAKKAENQRAKLAKAEEEPPEKYIRRRRHEGTPWANIVAGLNKEYLAPDGKKRWDLATVVEIDSQHFWTWWH